MLKETLEKLQIPALLQMSDGTAVTAETWERRRKEILELLSHEIYGVTPSAPEKVTGKLLAEEPPQWYGGKVIQQTFEISFETPGGMFSFPLIVARPRTEEKTPLVVHLAFRPQFPDRYVPVEEITDSGTAVAMLCYNDIAPDQRDNCAAGIAPLYGTRTAESWGKIGMWAFGTSRALDFLLTQDWVDEKNVAVMGHSRLGKTALWAAAQDDRFAFACSNCSGCSGASITRGKRGEHVVDICRNFPDWFCENYHAYAGKEDALPFDQHFLAALCAPRRVFILSAEMDLWADPHAEYLTCVAASEAYTLLGKEGFVCPDRLPTCGETFFSGRIAYTMRPGMHALIRTDWQAYLAYMKVHKNY